MPSPKGDQLWLVLASSEADENSSSLAETSPCQRSTNPHMYLRRRGEFKRESKSHGSQKTLKETCEDICFCLHKREDAAERTCGRDFTGDRAVCTFLEGSAL